tara:strand:+ start:1978 stop:2403 length:426 start_codon:yes stop_codon:yes gene_type:complete
MHIKQSQQERYSRMSVIEHDFKKRPLAFKPQDIEYLYKVKRCFENSGLSPHELHFGETDEGQGWCLVKRMCKRDGINWKEHMGVSSEEYADIVAEIVVTKYGYEHRGTWGTWKAKTIEGLFQDMNMPELYSEMIQKEVKDA